MPVIMNKYQYFYFINDVYLIFCITFIPNLNDIILFLVSLIS